MANPGYVRSTDGNNADNGSTWALANADLPTAMADHVAGDTVYVSDNHAESAAAAKTITMPGTVASPLKIIGADDAAEPPTALATTPTVTTTGNNGITLAGSGYVRGISFFSGTGNNGAILQVSNTDGDYEVFDNCNFYVVSTGTAARLRFGATASGTEGFVRLLDCGIRLGNASQNVAVRNTGLEWLGGSWLSGGTAPTTMIEGTGNTTVLLEGVNLTNIGTSTNLFTIASGTLRAIMRGCSLPGSWAGSLLTGTITPGSRVEMYNCDSADTNYRFWVIDYFGSITSETTIVRTGGASDGTTGLSFKMVSGADAEYPHQPLRTQEIAVWVAAGTHTVTVEIVNDGVTLDNDDIALEVSYAIGLAKPDYAHYSTLRDWYSSASNHASSSETWTTTGLSSPVKQKLEASGGLTSFNEDGWVIVKVALYRASTTVYVCPKVTVT